MVSDAYLMLLRSCKSLFWSVMSVTWIRRQVVLSQTPMREVAVRVFAREFSEATYTFQESDDDRSPVNALLPTGARANRLFIAELSLKPTISATWRSTGKGA